MTTSVTIVLLLAVLVLVGSGFLAAVPSMIGGGPRLTPLNVAQPVPAPFPAGPRLNSGYDVSFPQCERLLPAASEGFAIVGVNGGRAFADQPCFPDQAWWAQQHDGFAVYMNTEYDGTAEPVALGARMAQDVVARMDTQLLPSQTPVWLDVETDNNWRGTSEQHNQLLQSIAASLAEYGHPVGVYSAPKLWRTITGGVDPGMPIWLAVGKGTREKAEAACGRVG
ncbi:MAG: hypothetical protein QG597_23, partial [Actinomycetota bacterium]|nr:hypothetical protein [Actinomycetota bacterium]